MRICLFSQSLYALPLGEAIDATAAAGYSAIELACCKPHFDLERETDPQEDVARWIREAGLDVAALSLVNNLTERERLEEEIARAERYIALAPQFGTRVVKMTPGSPGSADATDGHWRALAEAVERLAPIARRVGVQLAFETHIRQLTDTLAGSLRLLEMAPADVVGLTVDFSNLRFAGEDLAAAIPALAPRMFHAHVKNGTIGDDGSWRFGPLDEGLTDYGLVLPILRQIGYGGYLSVECLGPDAREDPVGTARRDLAILQRYLDESD